MKKIVLLCSAGMSTSMLVKKMQAAAEAENYACENVYLPIQWLRLATRLPMLM